MNKKMREILAKITDLRAKARAKQDAGDIKDATDILDQIDTLQAEYDNEKRLYEAERNTVPDDPKPQDKASGFKAMAKLAKGMKLTDAEAALIIRADDDEEDNGENYLVPEDVRTRINELRRQYKSAKDLVTVIPTDGVLSGSMVFETEDTDDLTDFDDGEDIPTGGEPEFVKRSWKIKHYGKMFPVSNILLEAENAGLDAYLDRFYAKKAVRTENKKIFAAIKEGKTAATIKGLGGLKKAIYRLNAACRIDGVIVTNQSGFEILDDEKDALGRDLLSPSPNDPSKMTYKGFPIEVFDDAELPNVSGKPPVYYGSLKAAIDFMDKNRYQFATSEHVFFGKNQSAMRAIEGFDIMSADKDAYGYGLLVAAGPVVVNTKAVTEEEALSGQS